MSTPLLLNSGTTRTTNEGSTPKMMYVLAGLTLAALTIAAIVPVLTATACLKLITAERTHAATERAAHAVLLADLMQRIQAPEQAVVDHSITRQDPEPPQTLAMDDDAGILEILNGGLSKEDLAESSYMSELA